MGFYFWFAVHDAFNGASELRIQEGELPTTAKIRTENVTAMETGSLIATGVESVIDIGTVGIGGSQIT